MRVLHSLAELAQVPGPVCIAIGVFDGVHLGHQTLVREAMAEAEKRGGTAVALTFHPHPARILRPQSAPHLLTSTPHKVALIGALGCPYLLQVAFDEAFAAQSPQTFIEALAATADLRLICVGRDWAFGKNRAGNVALLKELGARLGFETLEIPAVSVDGEVISSTRIRKAVEAGDFATARKFLGREYTILGTVRHGAGLGGKIGFPTANLAAHSEQFPPNGVYAVRLMLRGEWYAGVANVGVRPTVANAGERLLETHIFDFTGDCYGEDVEVRFEHFLRPEQKFASVDELKKQIASDAARARELLR
jgi:riboflavin kinase/FMN adenylyltransferase